MPPSPVYAASKVSALAFPVTFSAQSDWGEHAYGTANSC